MSSGIVLCFLSALSFGLLGSASKAAEKSRCDAFGLVVCSFGWATLFMLLRTCALDSSLSVPARVVWTAIPFGFCAIVAFLAFQKSVSIGKVAVGWLVMNLSSGVPALVSIWLYKEPLTPAKCAAFVFALGSLWCLFKGATLENSSSGAAYQHREQRIGLWLLLMLLILATNGMSAFGLKIIADWGLAKSETFPYLTVWYAAGFFCGMIYLAYKRLRPTWRELVWGGSIAVFSIGGQLAMGRALSSNVPGNIVFPVAMGGSLLLVVMAGRWIFDEKMNRFSSSGIAVGILAVVVLSLS